MNKKPLPTNKKELNELKAFYKQAFDRLTFLISQSRNPETTSQLDRDLQEVQIIMDELDEALRKWSDERLSTAYETSWRNVALAMGVVAAISNASFIKSHSMKAVMDDTFQDLLHANNNMRKESSKLIREIFTEQMRLNTLARSGLRTTTSNVLEAVATNKGLQELVEKRVFVGIVDKAGRKWNMQTYVETVVQSKMTEIHLTATKDYLTEAMSQYEDVTDLVQISSHGASDSCRHFEGMIVSATGLTKGYPTLDEIRGSGLIFHPRCRHSIFPISSLDTLHESEVKHHEDNLSGMKKALANPKETMKSDYKNRQSSK